MTIDNKGMPTMEKAAAKRTLHEADQEDSGESDQDRGNGECHDILP
jgi:hypothetical protein